MLIKHQSIRTQLDFEIVRQFPPFVQLALKDSKIVLLLNDQALFVKDDLCTVLLNYFNGSKSCGLQSRCGSPMSSYPPC